MSFPSGFDLRWIVKAQDYTLTFDDLQDFRLTIEDVKRLEVKEREAFQLLCQKSLRFLVNCVLRPRSKKFLSFNERSHGKIFDSFLRPDPDKPFDEWSSIKERVTLAFRGATKSTIVGGFLCQVILCDPDIRTIVLSGKLSHAKSITRLGRKPFVTNEVIRELFPRWAVELTDDTGDTFTSPARDLSLDLRDPTIAIATFDSVKAGGHHELIILDDCTNEINCATSELVEKNEQHFDDTDELTEPGGYRHFFGTRWASDETDLPMVIRRRGEEHFAETGERNTEYTELPVWVLKDPNNPEVQERDRKNQLTASDVDIVWSKMTPRFLWPKYRANPQKFNGQYLLRWRGSIMTDSFPKELLVSCTVPFAEGMPKPHDRFLVINWDMGGVFTGRRPKHGFDFSFGVAGMFELSTRRLFFYDAIMEVFMSSTDAATNVVDFYLRQLRINPVGVLRIEDANGVRMLEGEILTVAKKMNVPLQIMWDATDNTFNSKNIAISMLSGPMKKGLIQFAASMPYREEVFKQFENWSPQPGLRRKDDGPDGCAQVWKAFSGQIFPNMVTAMQPSGQEFSFEPEVPQEVDPHADEKENADFALLNSMTVAH